MFDCRRAIPAAFAILIFAQPGFGGPPTFSSIQGRVIYKEAKHIEGHFRNTVITASKCEQKTKYQDEAAGTKPTTCRLNLYCYITAKTATTDDKILSVSVEHSIGISNVVVTATCPKNGAACPTVERCIDDAKTFIDDAPVVQEIKKIEDKKSGGKSEVK